MAGDKYLFPLETKVYYSDQPVGDCNVNWHGLDCTRLLLIGHLSNLVRPSCFSVEPERSLEFNLKDGRDAHDIWSDLKRNGDDVRILIVFPKRVDQDVGFTVSLVGRVDKVVLVKSELFVAISSIEVCRP